MATRQHTGRSMCTLSTEFIVNYYVQWSITLTQRGMALSELYKQVELQSSESPSSQLKNSRITRDNCDIKSLTDTLNNTCHPFSSTVPVDLVNVSTGKAASLETTSCIQRGDITKKKFEDECLTDSTRFMQTLSRIKIKNFASENVKQKTIESRKLNAAEGVRDVFARLLTIAAKESNTIDLRMYFPIRLQMSLSLAHADGTPLKTDKAVLTKLLERKQTSVLTNINLPSVSCTIIDGGLILHEVLIQHNTSSYGEKATELLLQICMCQGTEFHLLLDKYGSPSIKDNERILRCCTEDIFIITGSQ